MVLLLRSPSASCRLALVEYQRWAVVLRASGLRDLSLEALLATVFEHAQALDGMEVHL